MYQTGASSLILFRGMRVPCLSLLLLSAFIVVYYHVSVQKKRACNDCCSPMPGQAQTFARTCGDVRCVSREGLRQGTVVFSGGRTRRLM